MRILVYGGSFYPVHDGHIRIAELAAPYFDYVWFVPIVKTPYPKELAPFKDRVDMLNADEAIKNNPKFKVAKVDFLCNANGKTFHLMSELASDNPEIEFSVLMGDDSAISVWDQWPKGKKLVSNFQIVIVSSRGYAIPHWVKAGIGNPLVIYTNIPLYYSSTSARSKLEKYGNCAFIDHGVLEIIKKRGLYNVKASD